MALQKQGTVSETLKGCAALAQEEALALTGALGGIENISEQRMILIRDTARLGLVLRAVMARFLQGDGDPELGSRVATLTGARRQTLIALGLDRTAKDVTLNDALRDARENRSNATNGDTSDAEVVEPEITSDSPTSSADSRVATSRARDNGGGVRLVDRAPPPHAAANDQPEPPGSIERRST